MRRGDLVGPWGLAAPEAAVWRRWLGLHAGECGPLFYGVLVGEGRPAPPGVPRYLAERWRELTQLRVDVITVWRGQHVLIEVKPMGAMSAIGQLITYRACLGVEWAAWRAAGLVHVCGGVSADVLRGCVAAGVRVEVV
jgi:hypothetical protein